MRSQRPVVIYMRAVMSMSGHYILVNTRRMVTSVVRHLCDILYVGMPVFTNQWVATPRGGSRNVYLGVARSF
jgi:hypothetical protein